MGGSCDLDHDEYILCRSHRAWFGSAHNMYLSLFITKALKKKIDLGKIVSF